MKIESEISKEPSRAINVAKILDQLNDYQGAYQDRLCCVKIATF
jgi:hypothetical protein